jgi:hypothetical protein
LAVAKTTEPAGDGGFLPGTIDVVEPDFAHKVQYVRIITDAGVLTATAEIDAPLARAQNVRIVGRGQEVQLYNASDGGNLLLSI